WLIYPLGPHAFPTRRSSDLGVAHRAEGLTGKDQAVGRLPLVAGATEPRSQVCLLRGRRFEPRAFIAIAGSPVTVGDGLIRPIKEDRKSTRLNSSHVKISYAV